MYNENGNTGSTNEDTQRVNFTIPASYGYSRSVPPAPPEVFTAPPAPPAQSAPPPRKRKNGFRLFMAIFCLVCVLVGGTAGIGYSILRIGGYIGGDAVTTPVPAGSGQIVLPDLSTAVAVESPRVSNSTVVLSGAQIYKQSVNSCVGITSSYTTNNYFGGTENGTSTASGFIISEDGFIVTNNHVISNAYDQGNDVLITLHDGTEYVGKIVGGEPASDIALVKIEPKEKLVPLPLGSLDNMDIGEDVYVVGNPLGYLTFTYTSGILSARDREITTDASTAPVNMFQMTAAINSGNSGGPVFNNRGEVVGVSAAKPNDPSIEGIYFAIPIDDVRALIADWEAVGVRARPYLGITVKTVDGRDYTNNKVVKGAGVDSVTEGSPADEAGLKIGDVITKVDDHVITTHEGLISTVRRYYGAGETAKLSVYRAGETITLTITFGKLESTPIATPSPSLPDYFN
ncbi:MAG: S1C family serine protease [Oscillospiraceae bacterium]|jgi:serine protease Do|nr:S1C family serine protease [Oscillospiraceae bacterium]